MACQTIQYESTKQSECLFWWGEPHTKSAYLDESLEEWGFPYGASWYDVESSIGEATKSSIAEEFASLVREWKRSTWALSSIKRRIADPSYLKIIGMGEEAVPFIIAELRHEPDHWSFALEAITRQDPSPAGADMKAIVTAWLAWGEARGY